MRAGDFRVRLVERRRRNVGAFSERRWSRMGGRVRQPKHVATAAECPLSGELCRKEESPLGPLSHET